MDTKTYQILSIDAWRDGSGWTWNQWFNAGTIELSDAEMDSNRRLLRALRDRGPLSDGSKGQCCVDDDGYNLVICERGTMRPVFAVVYGDKI